MNSEIKVFPLTITPEIAAKFLEKNTRNRPLKYRHVDFLCDELKNGRWMFNGDSIRIDKDGSLIDGQHRLEAVVKTGISIDTLLMTGLDKNAFETIDSGANRSAGDTLSLAGEKSARNLAAALVVADDILSGKTDFVQSIKISNSEIMNKLARHPEIRNSTKWGSALCRLAPASASIAIHYIFSRKDKQKADEFFHAVATGENIDIDHPAYLLRQRLIDNATSKSKINRRYITALFIKAWNSWRSGVKLKTLRFRETGECPESFPVAK